MKKMLAAATMALSLGASGLAMAEPLKIGMITTLSGGGAGLGVDTRDGFMLAIKQSGNKDITVVTEDDAQKPGLAVQSADKLIQSDKVVTVFGGWTSKPRAASSAPTLARRRPSTSTVAVPGSGNRRGRSIASCRSSPWSKSFARKWACPIAW